MALVKCYVVYSAIKFVLSLLTLSTVKNWVCYNLRIFFIILSFIFNGDFSSSTQYLPLSFLTHPTY